MLSALADAVSLPGHAVSDRVVVRAAKARRGARVPCCVSLQALDLGVGDFVLSLSRCPAMAHADRAAKARLALVGPRRH